MYLLHVCLGLPSLTRPSYVHLRMYVPPSPTLIILLCVSLCHRSLRVLVGLVVAVALRLLGLLIFLFLLESVLLNFRFKFCLSDGREYSGPPK